MNTFLDDALWAIIILIGVFGYFALICFLGELCGFNDDWDPPA